MTLRERIEDHLMYWLAIAFASGVFFVAALTAIFGLEPVRRGSYVPREDLASQYVRRDQLQSTFIPRAALQSDYVLRSELASTHVSRDVLASQFIRRDVVEREFISRALLESGYLSRSEVAASYVPKADCSALPGAVSPSSRQLTPGSVLTPTNLRSADPRHSDQSAGSARPGAAGTQPVSPGERAPVPESSSATLKPTAPIAAVVKPSLERATYRMEVESSTKDRGFVSLLITFHSLSARTQHIQLRSVTLLDENGERWTCSGNDSAGFFDCAFGPGADLLPHARLRTKMVFYRGEANTGREFSLVANDGAPIQISGIRVEPD